MNNCTFSGRIARDAEVRYTQSGDAVASISIAVDRRRKKGEEQQPLWVRCTFWRKFAEGIAPHLKKGMVVVVSGEVDLNAYESHGETRSEIVIRSVQNFSFGGGAKKQAEDTQESATPQSGSWPENNRGHDDGSGPEISDEDIPF